MKSKQVYMNTSGQISSLQYINEALDIFHADELVDPWFYTLRLFEEGVTQNYYNSEALPGSFGIETEDCINYDSGIL